MRVHLVRADSTSEKGISQSSTVFLLTYETWNMVLPLWYFDFLRLSETCIKFAPKDVIIDVCVIIETLKTLNRQAISLLIPSFTTVLCVRSLQEARNN